MLEAIGQTVEVPESDVTLDLRGDETTLFEAADGSLYVEAPTGLYELSVGVGGVTPVQATADTSTMTELEPARSTKGEVDAGGVTEVSRVSMD